MNFKKIVGMGILVLMLLAEFVSAQPKTDERRAPPGMRLWNQGTGTRVGVTPELRRRGKEVYGMRCSSCHGVYGDGRGPASLYMDTPPRDFTKGVFKFRTTQEGMPTAEDLFRSVTAGFPAYGMPSFAYLSSEERWALVYHVEGLVKQGLETKFRKMAEEDGEDFDPELVVDWLKPGAEIQHTGQPPKMEAGSVARGRQLFKSNTYKCASCHGDSGKGDGPSALDQKDNWGNPSRPRDLTKGWSFRKSGWRTEDTVRVILYGINGTPMPANLYALETSEGMRDVWDMARFIDQLMSGGEGK